MKRRTAPEGLISPSSPGTWVVTSALVPLANSPVPVESTTACRGPAPSVVTMWKVPDSVPLVADTCGSVEPERSCAAATMETVFLPWPLVLPRPLVAILVEPKTVVSTSVCKDGCQLGFFIAGAVSSAYLGVGAGARDDGALDAKAGGVAAGITRDDGDLAVGGNEGRGGKRDEKELGEHVCVGGCLEKVWRGGSC